MQYGGIRTTRTNVLVGGIEPEIDVTEPYGNPPFRTSSIAEHEVARTSFRSLVPDKASNELASEGFGKVATMLEKMSDYEWQVL
jgi:hypothetical protein